MKMNINEGLPQICFLQQAHLDFPRNGGDKRDRTADLLNAIQALSQAIPSPTPKRMPQFASFHRLVSKCPYPPEIAAQ